MVVRSKNLSEICSLLKPYIGANSDPVEDLPMVLRPRGLSLEREVLLSTIPKRTWNHTETRKHGNTGIS